MNKVWINLKTWRGVIILALIAGFVLWLVLAGMPYVRTLRDKWQAQRLQDQWERPYREDKYGGKTPEETYDLFISALERGDTDLASKYFVLEKQDDWRKTLEEYEKEGLISVLVSERKKVKNEWYEIKIEEDDTRAFRYSVVIKNDTTTDFNGEKLNIPAGNYTNETVFQKYPSGIWKISVL